MQPEIKNIPILMYHSISEQSTEQFRLFTVPPMRFAEQMAFLHRSGYTPLTVTQFIQARQQGNRVLPVRPVLLTFDDGFADFYSAALPILRRFDFAATLYVATSYLEGTSGWLQRRGEGERRMLSWQQLREIAASGIECGGHSQRHVQLDLTPLAVARQEIGGCKALLEDRLDLPIHTFAYPFGYHTQAIKRAVQEAGYSSACAVKYAMSSLTTDAYALARLLVKPDMGERELAALLERPRHFPLETWYKQARAPLWRLARRTYGTLRAGGVA